MRRGGHERAGYLEEHAVGCVVHQNQRRIGASDQMIVADVQQTIQVFLKRNERRRATATHAPCTSS